MNKSRNQPNLTLVLILFCASVSFAGLVTMFPVSPLSKPAAMLLQGMGLICIARWVRKVLGSQEPRYSVNRLEVFPVDAYPENKPPNSDNAQGVFHAGAERM